MNVEDLDFLAEFYKKINSKNKIKQINLDEFKVEDGISYSFEEDIIEEIKDSLNEFNQCIISLKTIDMNNELESLVYQRQFISVMNKLYKVMGDISLEFSDFRDLDAMIAKNLPDGPQDDSELIN